jgi:hypothetical protein
MDIRIKNVYVSSKILIYKSVQQGFLTQMINLFRLWFRFSEIFIKKSTPFIGDSEESMIYYEYLR